MRREFEKVKKLTKQRMDASRRLDEIIQYEYGFSYSDFDNDEIIDTLDYATDDISYETFRRLMDAEKQKRK